MSKLVQLVKANEDSLQQKIANKLKNGEFLQPHFS